MRIIILQLLYISLLISACFKPPSNSDDFSSHSVGEYVIVNPSKDYDDQFNLSENDIVEIEQLVNGKIDFSTKLTKILALPPFENALFSLCVKEVDTDELIFEYKSDKSLIPASVLKLIPTATALILLGADYKYETNLVIDGVITDEGVLNGNIIIVGGGDPSLGSPRFPTNLGFYEIFHKWSNAIKINSIKKINGSIIADEGHFGELQVPFTWSFEDFINDYGVIANGLAIHENVFYLKIKPAEKINDPPIIEDIFPKEIDFNIFNELTTEYNAKGIYLLAEPFSKDRRLVGSVKPRKRLYTIKGAIDDPSLLIANILNDELLSAGIEITNKPYTINSYKLEGKSYSDRMTSIYSISSPKLLEILQKTNLYSINLFAEHLVKTLSKELGGVGDYRTGLLAIKNYWESEGVDLSSGFHIFDGSGLSRLNAITTSQLTNILVKIACKREFHDFLSTLPVGGQSGTIRRMFRETWLANEVHAKSGYMRRVRSYAGYLHNYDNKLFAFSVIVNNFSGSPVTMKNYLEAIILAISNLS